MDMNAFISRSLVDRLVSVLQQMALPEATDVVGDAAGELADRRRHPRAIVLHCRIRV